METRVNREINPNQAEILEKTRPYTRVTTIPVAGGWAGAVLCWAGAAMIWAGA